MKIQIVDEEELFVYESDESEIVYRRIPDDVVRKLNRRHTKKKGRDRTGQPIEEVDADALAMDMLDYIIVRWNNIVHPVTGEDVPCTRDYKGKLPADVKGELISLAQEKSGVALDEKKRDSNDSEATLSS